MGLFQNLTGWHALIILAVVILLFGATKLPALAKSVGQSMNIFKNEMRDATAPASAAATDPAAEKSAAAPVLAAAEDPRPVTSALATPSER